MGQVVRQVINTEACFDGTCNTTLSSLNSEVGESYHVSVSASNGVSQFSEIIMSNVIGKI